MESLCTLAKPHSVTVACIISGFGHASLRVCKSPKRVPHLAVRNPQIVCASQVGKNSLHDQWCASLRFEANPATVDIDTANEMSRE